MLPQGQVGCQGLSTAPNPHSSSISTIFNSPWCEGMLGGCLKCTPSSFCFDFLAFEADRCGAEVEKKFQGKEEAPRPCFQHLLSGWSLRERPGGVQTKQKVQAGHPSGLARPGEKPNILALSFTHQNKDEKNFVDTVVPLGVLAGHEVAAAFLSPRAGPHVGPCFWSWGSRRLQGPGIFLEAPRGEMAGALPSHTWVSLDLQHLPWQGLG